MLNPSEIDFELPQVPTKAEYIHWGFYVMQLRIQCQIQQHWMELINRGKWIHYTLENSAH